ncbi:G-D-S-L family lipolytic protein [Robertkochia aurantiaca]|uniref:G-D-S-L family lipolytic protein n=1 Tax=Robertkochia aurantiaca TaxID=2873700 RepID=UPI001CCEB4D7|nr:G-D-S-L family lipolytic protein [Robertkochia sp. 3YJGBD-33]
MRRSLYIPLLAGLFAACQPEFNDPVNEEGFYSSGEADLTTYVALGNSLTAGFADGALYRDAQINSYPNIIAQQFSLAGGGAFTQPLVNDNTGGLLANGQTISSPRLVLNFNENGSPVPVTLDAEPTTDITNVLEGPFNNMGVPGAKSYHLLANGYGNLGNFPTAANPYFIRMASSPDASILEDAVAQDPSFFSLWIGANDILGYATSGGTGVNQTGNLNPQTYGSNDITDPTLFGGVYQQILQGLTSNGAQGIVLNLPAVSGIPFFTTVPYNAIPLDAGTAALLNENYAAYNGGIRQLQAGGVISAEEADSRIISFQAGQNPVVILDESLTDLTGFNPALVNLRQATAEDLLPLPVSRVLGTLADPSNPLSVIGVAVPLNDAQVLTMTEVAEIEAVRAAYNNTIAALAQQFDLPLVDVDSLFDQLISQGIPYDGGTITATFGTGGAFSLDGVHLTQRGYAVIANEIIDQINLRYNASIPEVNAGYYPAVFVE